MRPSVLLLAVVAATVATPAWAWWDYARWGMTGPQLVAASKGAAQECRGGEGICREAFQSEPAAYYVPDLSIQGRSAYAQFVLDQQGKLRATFLWFRKEPGAFATLVNALNGVYGAPVAHETGWPQRYTWRDVKKGTQIRIWDFELGPRIEYRPIAKGL